MEYIKINPADNVAVAIRDLNSGNRVIIDNTEITLADNIPAGHKFLLKDCDFLNQFIVLLSKHIRILNLLYLFLQPLN